MKTIYLIRHAKSSWNNSGIADIDRPLNERGYADAHEMAKRLKKKVQPRDKTIEAILVSSPAIRAVSTALIFGRTLELDPSAIQLHPLLYDTNSKQYLAVIAGIREEYHAAFLFGHNPVITEAINLLGGVSLEDISTTGIVGIEFDCLTWKQCVETGGKMIFYDFPKNGE